MPASGFASVRSSRACRWSNRSCNGCLMARPCRCVQMRADRVKAWRSSRVFAATSWFGSVSPNGMVERCHLRDPSWFQWPLLEAAIEGNIVADFPLCNKSFNCSYSGHDL